MKRPPVNSPSWQHHNWQVLTYSWLRSMQPESRPVLIGILFYLNELSLFKEDLKELKKEVEDKSTDIMPPENDLMNILQWNTKSKPPLISETFKIFDFECPKISDFRRRLKMRDPYELLGLKIIQLTVL